jgi:hypothetical protein
MHWNGRPSAGGGFASVAGGAGGYAGGMDRLFGLPPRCLFEIEALARAALARLPEPFAAHLDGVLLLVEDFADEETLADWHGRSLRTHRDL